MNDWSKRRKRFILLLIFTVLVLLIGVPSFLVFYQTPNCFDDKQNGDEAGVDCGGSCALLCRDESLPVLMKGDVRILTVASSTYSVVAVFDNPNVSAEVYSARYTIKLFDASSVLPVKTIEGNTHIPKSSEFAVFGGPFNLDVVPTRAIFEWTDPSFSWQKNIVPTPSVVVSGEVFSKEDSEPRLDMIVSNLSLETVANIELIALVSDTNGNIFTASKTLVDILQPGQSIPAVMTWPRPFPLEMGSVDIMIRILPDRGFIR